MHAPSPSTLTLLVLVPLLVWRIRALYAMGPGGPSGLVRWRWQVLAAKRAREAAQAAEAVACAVEPPTDAP